MSLKIANDGGGREDLHICALSCEIRKSFICKRGVLCVKYETARERERSAARFVDVLLWLVPKTSADNGVKIKKRISSRHFHGLESFRESVSLCK